MTSPERPKLFKVTPALGNHRFQGNYQPPMILSSFSVGLPASLSQSMSTWAMVSRTKEAGSMNRRDPGGGPDQIG